jgi:hypothetical protein
MYMTDEQAWIGRWLGIAHLVGSNKTYWILTQSGQSLLVLKFRQFLLTSF